MDEGSQGGPGDAEGRIVELKEELRAFLQSEAAILRVMRLDIEADMQSLRRSKRLWRVLIFWNVACGAWCLSLESWVSLLALVAAHSAWKAFRISEDLSGEFKELEARWATVKEKMKNIEREANESRA